jgi:hypothetical protein
MASNTAQARAEFKRQVQQILRQVDGSLGANKLSYRVAMLNQMRSGTEAGTNVLTVDLNRDLPVSPAAKANITKQLNAYKRALSAAGFTVTNNGGPGGPLGPVSGIVVAQT